MSKSNTPSVFALVFGAASMLLLSGAILGGYLWVTQGATGSSEVHKPGPVHQKAALARVNARSQLIDYRKLDDTHYQVPIEQAMKLVVQDYRAK